MKRSLIIVLVLMSCNVNTKSKIVVHKINRDSIYKIIMERYILINTDTPARHDFYYIYQYKNKGDSSIFKILEDSLHNIKGINISRNGINIFGAEYYANGQIKGDVPINKSGETEGLATYYYEDGRIRCKGYWKEYQQVGEWKYYDKDGNPVKSDSL